jgi:WD40 repeat protein
MIEKESAALEEGSQTKSLFFRPQHATHAYATSCNHYQCCDSLVALSRTRLFFFHARGSLYEYNTLNSIAHLAMPKFTNDDYDWCTGSIYSVRVRHGFLLASGQGMIAVKRLSDNKVLAPSEHFNTRLSRGMNNGLDISYFRGQPRLYVARNQATITIFSLPSMELVGVLPMPNSVNYVSCSPDNRRLLALGDYDYVHIYSIDQSIDTAQTRDIPHPRLLKEPLNTSPYKLEWKCKMEKLKSEQLPTLKISHNFKQVAISKLQNGNGNNSAKIEEEEDILYEREWEAAKNLSGSPQYCDWSQDGTMFAVTSECGLVAWWHSETKQLLGSYLCRTEPYTIRFGPRRASNLLAFVEREVLHVLNLYNPAQHQILCLPKSSFVTGLDFAEDGTKMFVGTKAGILEYTMVGVYSLVDQCLTYIQRNANMWTPEQLQLLPQDLFERLFNNLTPIKFEVVGLKESS